jgi:hypothetical protein
MKYLLMALLLLPTLVSAQSINLPGAPRPTGFDELRTSSGTTCKQAAGSNLNVDFGLVASTQDRDNKYSDENRDAFAGEQGNAAFARVSYAIGAPKRLDCSKLYDIELETLRLELQALKEQLLYEMD